MGNRRPRRRGKSKCERKYFMKYLRINQKKR